LTENIGIGIKVPTMTKEGVKPPVLSAEWLANYNHQMLQPHPEWGIGIRFRLGKTTLDYFPAPAAPDLHPAAKLKGSPNTSGKRTIIDLPEVVEINGVPELEPVTGYGLYLKTQTDEVLIKSNGQFTLWHYGELQKPQQEEKTSVQVTTIEDKEKQPRVKVSGFFGKVLDGFPRQTEDDKTIYKLLIGNDVKENADKEGSGKIAWTVVTALEPHVVKFLEQNVETFEKRKTQLRVEGYFQEVEKQLRRSVKKTQELYALSIKQVEP
jgi:hypothetical protein